ncbi:hypothetical protein B0H11DRAFT_1924824 [Mycena galericulata]|nr:hypothetical protein B0H11DRAFT_1924824 [Mycena galericulata]
MILSAQDSALTDTPTRTKDEWTGAMYAATETSRSLMAPVLHPPTCEKSTKSRRKGRHDGQSRTACAAETRADAAEFALEFQRALAVGSPKRRRTTARGERSGLEVCIVAIIRHENEATLERSASRDIRPRNKAEEAHVSTSDGLGPSQYTRVIRRKEYATREQAEATHVKAPRTNAVHALAKMGWILEMCDTKLVPRAQRCNPGAEGRSAVEGAALPANGSHFSGYEMRNNRRKLWLGLPAPNARITSRQWDTRKRGIRGPPNLEQTRRVDKHPGTEIPCMTSSASRNGSGEMLLGRSPGAGIWANVGQGRIAMKALHCRQTPRSDEAVPSAYRRYVHGGSCRRARELEGSISCNTKEKGEFSRFPKADAWRKHGSSRTSTAGKLERAETARGVGGDARRYSSSRIAVGGASLLLERRWPGVGEARRLGRRGEDGSRCHVAPASTASARERRSGYRIEFRCRSARPTQTRYIGEPPNVEVEVESDRRRGRVQPYEALNTAVQARRDNKEFIEE